MIRELIAIVRDLDDAAAEAIAAIRWLLDNNPTADPVDLMDEIRRIVAMTPAGADR